MKPAAAPCCQSNNRCPNGFDRGGCGGRLAGFTARTGSAFLTGITPLFTTGPERFCGDVRCPFDTAPERALMAAAVLAVGAAVAGAATSSLVGAAVGGAVGAALGAVAAGAVTVGVSYLGQAVVGSPDPGAAAGLAARAAGAAPAPADALRGGRTLTVVQPVTSHKIIYGAHRVGGPLVFTHSHQPDGAVTEEILHLVVVHAAHQVDEIGEVYLNDLLATDARYDGVVQVWRHLGTPDQVADANLVGEAAGRWTDAHRLRGRAYTHLRLAFDETAFAGGVPNVSAVVRGKRVYDPRTGGTAWSDNAALCLLDYLTGAHGLGTPLDEIDTDSFIAAASICDEPVATLTGTEPRYTANGVVDLGNRPVEILEALLTSCAGRLSFVAGRWRLHVGAWQAPAHALDERHARAPITLRPQRSRRDLVNTVRGAFTSPDHGWQPTDYPPVSVAGYVAADGGAATMTLDLPFTTSPSMAQRIARIALEQNRRQRQIAFPANLAGLELEAGGTATVSLARFGLVDLPVCVASWRMSEDMGVDLTLQEDHPDVYAHSAAWLVAMG